MIPKNQSLVGSKLKEKRRKRKTKPKQQNNNKKKKKRNQKEYGRFFEKLVDNGLPLGLTFKSESI